MTKRIPPEAFDHYVSLGPSRSYKAVASHYKVTKRGITKRANIERWQERLAEIERQARERGDVKLVDVIEEMRERHLKIIRAIQSKALDALRALPVDSAMNAVRSLDLAMRNERLLHGEPSERTAVSIEDTIRKEYETWMETGDDDGSDDQAPEQE